jgi:hypothetical protein
MIDLLQESRSRFQTTGCRKYAVFSTAAAMAHQSLARVIACGLQQCTFSHSLGLVESEQARCDFALRRERFDDGAGDAKVIRPLVQPRMKEADDFSGSRVDGCDIGTLVTIAEYAAQGQVVQAGIPAVFPAYDVVHLMREGRARVWIQAILTARLGASADFSP